MSTFKKPQRSAVDELPRDRWGRPLITPPEGGDPVAYTRVTTFASTIEDTYHLGRWSDRMVALGMAKRRDLQLAGSAISDPLDPGQKRNLQDIANRAKDSAMPSAAAIGTALHTFTETADLGGDLSDLPDEYAPDIQAYSEATAHLSVHSVETFVVNDTYRLGGTYDRIYIPQSDIQLPHKLADALHACYGVDTLAQQGITYASGGLVLRVGTPIIGDIKSGRTVSFGAGTFAIQLGAYSQSCAYSHTTGTRTDLPNDLSRILGLIVHVPAGTGTATLHWVRIDEGWSMAKTCLVVRDWRARRDLIHQASGTINTTPTPPSLASAISNAATIPELELLYHINRTAWTPGLTSLAASRKRSILEAAA